MLPPHAALCVLAFLSSPFIQAQEENSDTQSPSANSNAALEKFTGISFDLEHSANFSIAEDWNGSIMFLVVREDSDDETIEPPLKILSILDPGDTTDAQFTDALANDLNIRLTEQGFTAKSFDPCQRTFLGKEQSGKRLGGTNIAGWAVAFEIYPFRQNEKLCAMILRDTGNTRKMRAQLDAIVTSLSAKDWSIDSPVDHELAGIHFQLPSSCKPVISKNEEADALRVGFQTFELQLQILTFDSVKEASDHYDATISRFGPACDQLATGMGMTTASWFKITRPLADGYVVGSRYLLRSDTNPSSWDLRSLTDGQAKEKDTSLEGQRFIIRSGMKVIEMAAGYRPPDAQLATEKLVQFAESLDPAVINTGNTKMVEGGGIQVPSHDYIPFTKVEKDYGLRFEGDCLYGHAAMASELWIDVRDDLEGELDMEALLKTYVVTDFKLSQPGVVSTEEIRGTLLGEDCVGISAQMTAFVGQYNMVLFAMPFGDSTLVAGMRCVGREQKQMQRLFAGLLGQITKSSSE